MKLRSVIVGMVLLLGMVDLVGEGVADRFSVCLLPFNAQTNT